MPIVSFVCGDAEELRQTGQNKRFAAIAAVALRSRDHMNAAVMLADLRSPPGNRLEALKGDRAGPHSIRINDQSRICFVWTDGSRSDIEICDDH